MSYVDNIIESIDKWKKLDVNSMTNNFLARFITYNHSDFLYSSFKHAEYSTYHEIYLQKLNNEMIKLLEGRDINGLINLFSPFRAQSRDVIKYDYQKAFEDSPSFFDSDDDSLDNLHFYGKGLPEYKMVNLVHVYLLLHNYNASFFNYVIDKDNWFLGRLYLISIIPDDLLDFYLKGETMSEYPEFKNTLKNSDIVILKSIKKQIQKVFSTTKSKGSQVYLNNFSLQDVRIIDPFTKNSIGEVATHVISPFKNKEHNKDDEIYHYPDNFLIFKSNLMKRTNLVNKLEANEIDIMEYLGIDLSETKKTDNLDKFNLMLDEFLKLGKRNGRTLGQTLLWTSPNVSYLKRILISKVSTLQVYIDTKHMKPKENNDVYTLTQSNGYISGAEFEEDVDQKNFVNMELDLNLEDFGNIKYVILNGTIIVPPKHKSEDEKIGANLDDKNESEKSSNKQKEKSVLPDDILGLVVPSYLQSEELSMIKKTSKKVSNLMDEKINTIANEFKACYDKRNIVDLIELYKIRNVDIVYQDTKVTESLLEYFGLIPVKKGSKKSSHAFNASCWAPMLLLFVENLPPMLLKKLKKMGHFKFQYQNSISTLSQQLKGVVGLDPLIMVSLKDLDVFRLVIAVDKISVQESYLSDLTSDKFFYLGQYYFDYHSLFRKRVSNKFVSLSRSVILREKINKVIWLYQYLAIELKIYDNDQLTEFIRNSKTDLSSLFDTIQERMDSIDPRSYEELFKSKNYFLYENDSWSPGTRHVYKRLYDIVKDKKLYKLLTKDNLFRFKLDQIKEFMFLDVPESTDYKGYNVINKANTMDLRKYRKLKKVHIVTHVTDKMKKEHPRKQYIKELSKKSGESPKTITETTIIHF